MNDLQPPPATPVKTSTDSGSSTLPRPTRGRNLVISGTNFWNPGDDFVRDGIIHVLRRVFPDEPLNFLFYNFNADFFPQDKFAGIGNYVAAGDLGKYRDFVDAVIIAGLSAGDEIKDLYRWVIANGLEEKVYLIGAGYENDYVARHIAHEPEATIFRKARLVTGRTAKTPAFIQAAGIPYFHINCPAILSVPEVKKVPAGSKIERIGFSIQLPHGEGLVNHSCAREQYELSVAVLRDLARQYAVEVVAHHKTEYFHFLKLLRGTDIPVNFSSFYQDLHQIYPRYDLVVTTRLHSSLFANGHGIPGIIINDTDRHTHTLEGFPHSLWVNDREKFNRAFAHWEKSDLAAIAREAADFKRALADQYVSVLSRSLGGPLRSERDDYAFDSERKEQLLVRSLVKAGMTVLDVGANIGKYTKLFSLLAGGSGRVFAFEPDPGSGQCLRHLVERDALSNVTVVNAAVSDASGTATLNRFPEEYSSWNGFGRPAMENPKNPSEFVPIVGSVEVETVTLDEFCRAHGIHEIDYLKLDVEGAELKALKGAQDLLARRAIRHLQFEVSRKMLEGLHTTARPVFDLLASHGYECHAITTDGRMAEVVADSSAFYENYVAIPAKPVAGQSELWGLTLLALLDSDNKRRVHKVISGLTKDYWLERNLVRYQDTENHWFDTATFLNWFAHHLLPRNYLEIGVRRGRSMAQVLVESPHTQAHGFDLWIPGYGSVPEQGIVTENPGPEFVWQELQNLGVKKLPQLTKGDSHATVPAFFKDPASPQWFDLILVDGDHTAAGAEQDLEIAFAHLAPGGALIFDDIYNPAHCDLLDVWNRFVRRFPDHLFFTDKSGAGTAVAIRPPFDKLSAAIGLKPMTTTPPAPEPPKPTVAERDPLPVHFFTIVLNGQPFIRHHIEQLRQLPFRWHWHIVEGVAELNHDTAWSKAAGGKIPASLHRAGLSADGTTEYLDALQKEFPEHVTIYRPAAGRFWDGKREMVNAPLAHIHEPCLLWQVDADELWTTSQIIRTRSLFLAHPENTAALFHCEYFVGPKLVITSRDTYGNHSEFEWLRVWRYEPLDRWAAHEPPRLHRGEQDVASINAFRQAETEAMGLVFQHYAYATEEQIRFKETYYGYAGATRQWRKLQRAENFPQRLAEHFAWVKDEATVDSIERIGLQRLAPDDWFEPTTGKPPAASPLEGAERILLVRTDSIGDAVLASAMLEPIRRRFPRARIAMLCQAHMADLYLASPFLDAIICYDRAKLSDAAERSQLFAEIAAFKPDVVLNSVRSRDRLSNELAQAFPGARHIAIEGDLNNISPEDHESSLRGYEQIIPSAGERRTELARHADFLAGLGIQARRLQAVAWTGPVEERLADELFQLHQLDPLKTMALFPVTQHGIKDYPAFAEVLKGFADWNFLILGGAGTEPSCAELAKKLPGRVWNFAGLTSLREMTAIIRRCRILLGSDSCGPHLACAVGVPNVVLLGGGHFGRFMPHSPLTSAVVLPLDCFGCNWSCCHQRSHCIKDVRPEIVAEALRQTLEKPSRRPRLFVQPATALPPDHGCSPLPDLREWLPELDVEIIEPATERVAACETEIIGKGISDPLVTAIVSTYNSERFMAACMEDLIAQTILDQLEILVIDSGSQENERAIVARYQEKHPNIRYVRTAREPLYKAWNRAVGMARGKYVVNANTDDSRRPDAFEVLLAGMEAHPDADLAYAHYYMTSRPNDPFPPTSVFRDVCHDPYHPAQLLFYCITGCLQFWRKSALLQLGGFDESLKCVGDYEILLRFLRQGMKPLLVPDKLSCFYINREGLSFGGTTAGKEDIAIKKRYRQEVDVSEIFAVNVKNPRDLARAWIALGNFAASVPVPWSDQPHTFYDYSINCYQRALQYDPQSTAAWHNVAVLSLRLNITDFLSQTFGGSQSQIAGIIENAKRNPKLVGVEFKPRETGYIHRSSPPAATPPGPLAIVPPSAAAGPDAAGKVSVDWIGSFLDHGSLSHVNRELTRALAPTAEIQLQRVNKGAAASPAFHELASAISSKASADAAITVRHAWPPNWSRPKQGKLVVIQPWEFGALPVDWVRAAEHVDEFWLPSRYVRNVYIESGVPANKLAVVPNGVDAEKFRPQAAPMPLATQKKFKLLFVGGTIHRKGPDLLLKAYLENFSAADDVCLVIKDFGGQGVYAGQTFEQQIRAAQARPGAPEILYLNEELAAESLPGLYTAANCLVLPYRGEGFGLPVLEAMACGLPVIVTAGGATDDFVRDDFAWRIPAERRAFGREVSGMKLAGPGWWLEPDLAALGKAMREAFANPAATRTRGEVACSHARERFTWKQSAAVAVERIRELVSKRVETHAALAEGGVGGASATKQTKPAAITLPPCALVGHLAEARELVRRKNLSGAWAATVAALAKRPFHPEAYLLLGEIALAAGNGQAAKRCAEYASRIAPGFKPAKKFLNQRFKGDARPGWLELPESIGHRPSAFASRLSVCLIVKNEEKFLAQCLNSVRGLAPQIVVVDTGSTDRTVEIARECGAEVHAFAWCDDFSAARNAALEHVTGDWVLALDADEELSADGRENLRQAMSSAAVMAWRLPIVDVGREAEGCSHVPRLFRNAPGLFYIGRVHEQVFSSLEARREEWGLENRIGDVTLVHHGYTAAMTRDRNKVARNLRLLEQAIIELPGEPHLLMNLGLELARAGRQAEALERYGEAFDVLSAKPQVEIVPELRETLLTQFCARLTAAKRFDEVVRVLTAPLAKGQGGLTASLHFSLGLAHLELKQFGEAADHLRQCLAKRGRRCLAPINPDINTAAPHHCLALCLARLGDATAAEQAFQAGLQENGHGAPLRLDYARFRAERNRPVEALELLNAIVAQDPQNSAAWRLGGQIALSRPEFLEFARDWTGEAMRYAAEDLVVASHRAEALLLSGDTAGASELWERVWNSERRPGALAALILCEAIEAPTTHAPTEGTEEAIVSRAFVGWYQKLIKTHAPTVGRLNEQVEKLARALPTAAKILEAALAEADQLEAPAV